MVNYYSILNLGLNKKRGNITDELVKNHYEKAMKLCEEQGIKFFGSMEVLEDYKEMLKDAYRAIGTENARKHYDELLYTIEEYMRTKKVEKLIEQKSKKVELDKGKISNFKDAIRNITKNEDTKEILEQIKKQAQEKYPIPKPPKKLEERER